ncbi:glucose dehydrogenase [FAD, quinone]-like [Pararge aegeria]|uniref:glucose dehydrogenase [FAD, quinone]-like n=1 Tax=Pararge aegeria TaxID=116150 RepID=UPI0019D22836|nr:glucose dehydrogenase [FAD, quinone]-like [Pararge aegeria]
MSVQAILRTQQALSVLAALMLTAHWFPKQAVVVNYEEFDFIIVGAGSAGSVVADRLSECAARRVLVIDAGGDPPLESMTPALFSYLPDTKYDWNFTSENDNYTSQSHSIKALNLTSGRVLGGGSSLNYLMYVRGCAGDYDSWARAVRDDSWSYRNILAYFIKSERLEDPDILSSPDCVFHGTDGFLGVTRENRKETYTYLDAFKEAGHDIVFDVNGRKSIGYTLPLLTVANGIRQTTAYTNLGVNKDRENLHILKNTLVSKILFDENNNAIGVTAITADNRKLTLLANKEVIISAGALNTPKLLMLSGIGPKEHLESMKIKVRSDLPVGMNLQDHVNIIVSIKMEASSAPPVPQNPNQFPIPFVVGYVAINKSRSCAEYQVFNFITPNDSESPSDLCEFNYGYEQSICRHILEAGKGRNTLFVNLNHLHPKSRGRVTLRSNNPQDSPIVNLGTLSDDRDLDDLADYLYDYVQVVNTTYFRNVNAEIVDLNIPRCKGLQFASRPYWRCYALYMTTTMFHYAGTSAMGSVVDGRLRVLRVQRLRVADNSVMPTLISGNTNAAALMIGEKASDMIKRDHPQTGPQHAYYAQYYRRFD